MRDASHILGVVDLIEGDLLGADVLYMAYPAVGEHVPLDLELPKYLLKLGQDVLHGRRVACEL